MSISSDYSGNNVCLCVWRLRDQATGTKRPEFDTYCPLSLVMWVWEVTSTCLSYPHL